MEISDDERMTIQRTLYHFVVEIDGHALLDHLQKLVEGHFASWVGILAPTKVDDVRQIAVIALDQVVEEIVVVDEFPVRAGIDDRIRIAATGLWIWITFTLLRLLIATTWLRWKGNRGKDHTVAALAFRAVFQLVTHEVMNVRAFTRVRWIWTSSGRVMFVPVGAPALFGRFFWTGFIPRFQAQFVGFAEPVVFLPALVVTAGRRQVYRL